ncbi:MAG: hypothetical protein ABR518_10520 [Actinomycetota bacterium]
MTENKTFKRRVRARMTKTGESYATARERVEDKRDRNTAARVRLSAADDLISGASLRGATGKAWEEWFAILDRWGAREKKHPEIVRYLMGEHGVRGWWSQSITVGYERARGMRLKYQSLNGGFTATASKTIAVSVDVLFDAFVDERQRRTWLSEGAISLRASQPGRSARFDWEDGSTRVNVGFTPKGPSKATVSVSHERLPDADDVEATKAMWKQRLDELKTSLES